MHVPLYFPSGDILTPYLTQHPLLREEDLNTDTDRELVRAIIQLATKRFANQVENRESVRGKCITIITDLVNGKDSVSQEPLQKFSRARLPPIMWALIVLAVRTALIDCANGANV